jgi:aminoglycoside phosphotransferase (APT) family kinase protein
MLRTVAHASLDLLRINQNATVTARDWITAKIRRKIIRAQNGTLPGGTVAECEHQLELVENYWVPELDNRPHVLVHGDLSGNNIIVDQDQSVRG